MGILLNNGIYLKGGVRLGAEGEPCCCEDTRPGLASVIINGIALGIPTVSNGVSRSAFPRTRYCFREVFDEYDLASAVSVYKTNNPNPGSLIGTLTDVKIGYYRFGPGTNPRVFLRATSGGTHYFQQLTGTGSPFSPVETAEGQYTPATFASNLIRHTPGGFATFVPQTYTRIDGGPSFVTDPCVCPNNHLQIPEAQRSQYNLSAAPTELALQGHSITVQDARGFEYYDRMLLPASRIYDSTAWLGGESCSREFLIRACVPQTITAVSAGTANTELLLNGSPVTAPVAIAAGGVLSVRRLNMPISATTSGRDQQYLRQGAGTLAGPMQIGVMVLDSELHATARAGENLVSLDADFSPSIVQGPVVLTKQGDDGPWSGSKSEQGPQSPDTVSATLHRGGVEGCAWNLSISISANNLSGGAMGLVGEYVRYDQDHKGVYQRQRWGASAGGPQPPMTATIS